METGGSFYRRRAGTLLKTPNDLEAEVSLRRRKGGAQTKKNKKKKKKKRKVLGGNKGLGLTPSRLRERRRT